MNGSEITAVAYDGAGREIGRRSLRSAGETTELRAEVEYRGRDLAFVRVRYTDADGVTKPLERGMLRVSSVTGGELLGFGCAAPYNPGSFVTGETDTYYGEALAVVRVGGGGAVGAGAALTVTEEARGLTAAVTID